MDYNSLTEQIKQYSKRTDEFFISQIPNFINQAINRIYSEAKNIGFETVVFSNAPEQQIQANNFLFPKPTNWKETVILFDMEVAKLQEHYGEPYNKAYDEIRAMMEDLGFVGFVGTQGSLCVSKNEKNDLTTVYKVINKLSNVQWFSDSVRDIRALKVEDWSDFTEIVKNNR